MKQNLSWIEIDLGAITKNINSFRRLLPSQAQLMSVVKGEAYGHGMIEVARCALGAGASWLGVFHLEEALRLRQAGIQVPILALGYVPLDDLGTAIQHQVRITVSSLQTAEVAATAAAQIGQPALLHLKLECGTNRLGLDKTRREQVLKLIQSKAELTLEGAHTHFANIEDTTEHDFAKAQLESFRSQLESIRNQGVSVPIPHTACTAATILFPETYFQMVRVGIGQYGLWPSKETYLSALLQKKDPLQLKPAMCWKTKIIQLKEVAAFDFIGYGCTYRTTRKTNLAIIPIGYANGYDRALSNQGHVLVRGKRAPIRGRVCMNLTMVDVTDIEGVQLEDEVVVLGFQGAEQISAEQMAEWAKSINYEIVTRADPLAARIYT